MKSLPSASFGSVALVMNMLLGANQVLHTGRRTHRSVFVGAEHRIFHKRSLRRGVEHGIAACAQICAQCRFASVWIAVGLERAKGA